MKTSAVLTVAALLAALPHASAQPPDQTVSKTVYFAHLSQDLGEVASAIRTIAGMPMPAVDETKKSLTLRGTSDQVALGEWLFNSLDAAGSGNLDPNIGAPYRVSGNDDIVRVIYLGYASTVQDQQEVATAIRTIAEIRPVWVYSPQKAMVLRGTAEQLAMADWVSSAFDRHKKGDRGEPGEFRMTAGGENVMRVLWVSAAPGVREFQSLATLMRSAAAIRRVFTYNDQKAIVIRGTADQVDLAAWLTAELDQPAHATSPRIIPYLKENVLRVYYLNPKTVGPGTPDAEMSKIASEVRASIGIPMVMPYTPTFAITVRGSEEQLAAAEKMLAGRLLASAP